MFNFILSCFQIFSICPDNSPMIMKVYIRCIIYNFPCEPSAYHYGMPFSAFSKILYAICTFPINLVSSHIPRYFTFHFCVIISHGNQIFFHLESFFFLVNGVNVAYTRHTDIHQHLLKFLFNHQDWILLKDDVRLR